MSDIKRCTTNFVEDVPKDKDAFDGEAHSRVAEAIAGIIDTAKGGKTIGLEGGWGTGKSTVVAILENEYVNKNSNYKSFVFDAWAHEGDSLRRNFLYQLIVELDEWIPDKIIESRENPNAKKWTTQKKDELEGKTVVSDSTVSTTLKSQSVFAAVVTTIVAIGLSFIREGIGIGVTLLNTGTYNEPFITGLLIVFPTLLLAFILNIALLRSRGKDNKTIGLFTDVTHNDTTVTGFESPVLTSFEFENIFNETIDKALPKSNKNRRLIIVVDNLDRIPAEEALNILSTLHIFLQHGQQPSIKENDGEIEEIENIQKIWIVIPYDYEGLKNLWDGDDKVAKSMLEKRFQLHFQVPPLVLSNWRNYFLEKLRFAFPSLESHPNEEFLQIYHLYRLYFKELNLGVDHTPTPRHLITFINQIGSLHQQWGDIFPLDHLAFFVLEMQKVNSKKITEKLLDKNGDYPSSKIKNYLSAASDIKANLAALWFNVPREIGQQLLLREPLTNALREGDNEKLNTYFENGIVIWPVLETILSDITDEFHQLSEIQNVIHAISGSVTYSRGTREQQREFLQNIEEGIASSSLDKEADEDSGTVFANLLEIANKKSLAEVILKKYSSIFSNAPYGPDPIQSWIIGLFKFIANLKKSGVLEQNKITIPTGPEGMVGALEKIVISDPDKIYWKYFDSKNILNDIHSTLPAYIAGGNFNQHSISILRIIDEIAPDKTTINWEPIVEALDIQTKAIPQDANNTPQFLALLDALWLIGSQDILTDSVDKKITDTANQGYMAAFLIHGPNNTDADNAKLLFFYTMANPALPEPTVTGVTGKAYIISEFFTKPKEYEEIMEEYLGILESQEKNEVLEQLWKNNPKTKKWVSFCFYMLARKSKKDLLNLEFIVKNWNGIKSQLDKEDEWEKFLDVLIKNTNLLIYLQTLEFTQSLASFSIWLINSKTDKDFIAWCSDKLKSLSKELWLKSISAHKGYPYVIYQLLAINEEIDLGQNYRDAMKDYSELVLTESKQPAGSVDNWANLFKASSDYNRGILREKLLSKMRGKDGKIPEVFFNYYGKEMNHCPTLKKDERILSELFEPIFRDQSIVGTTWLYSVSEKCPDLIKNGKHSTNHRKSFADRIQLIIDNPSIEEEYRLQVRSIADNFDIKIKKPKKEKPKETEQETEEPSS